MERLTVNQAWEKYKELRNAYNYTELEKYQAIIVHPWGIEGEYKDNDTLHYHILLEWKYPPSNQN